MLKLGEDAVYNCIDSMIKESKYCSDVIKEFLTKNFSWLRKIMKILRTLLNARLAIMVMLIVILE